MVDTARIKNTNLTEAQNQKATTVNDFMSRHDIISVVVVWSKGDNTPPNSPPDESEAYIVGSAPADEWSTFAENDIAYFSNGWRNFTPVRAVLAFVEDVDELWTYDVDASPAAWTQISLSGGGGDVTKVGTPLNNQIGVWTGDGTIEGDVALTFDTAADRLAIGVSGKLAFGAVDVLVDVAGVMTLSEIDALDATTEATIEAAIDTLANLTSASALATIGTITTGVWEGTDIAVADGGTGASTAGGAQTNLGLAIGSDVQAFGAVLDDWNTLGAVGADGEIAVGTAAGVFAYESGSVLRDTVGVGLTDNLLLATVGTTDAGSSGVPQHIVGTAGTSGIRGSGATDMRWVVAGGDQLDVTGVNFRGISLGDFTIRHSLSGVENEPIYTWSVPGAYPSSERDVCGEGKTEIPLSAGSYVDKLLAGMRSAVRSVSNSTLLNNVGGIRTVRHENMNDSTFGTTSAASAVVTGTGTGFLSTVEVGDILFAFNTDNASDADLGGYQVTVVTDNTTLTVDRNFSLANTTLDFYIIRGGVTVINDQTDQTVYIGEVAWPAADGTNGQAIITDGAGQLSFSTISGGDLWSDVVDAVITPDGDGTRDFGLTGTRFAIGFFDDLDVTTSLTIGADTILVRDAANMLAMRNGVNAQTFITYGTFTDASNYERAEFGHSGSVAFFNSAAAGSGTVEPFRFQISGSKAMDIGTDLFVDMFRAARIEDLDGAAGTVLNVLDVRRITNSGSPVAGIGVGISMSVETAAGNNEIGAIMEAVTTDVTGGSEDFDMVFKLMAAGAAAADAFRILSTGTIQFGTHTGIGAETVTGFITVKDSGGTDRKLAVVS